MYLADTLPKNIVNLLGRTNVGIARKKIVMSPANKKRIGQARNVSAGTTITRMPRVDFAIGLSWRGIHA